MISYYGRCSLKQSEHLAFVFGNNCPYEYVRRLGPNARLIHLLARLLLTLHAKK